MTCGARVGTRGRSIRHRHRSIIGTKPDTLNPLQWEAQMYVCLDRSRASPLSSARNRRERVDRDGRPGRACPDNAQRPMTFLDMQQMRQVALADAEPGRQVAAVYAVDARLEGGQAPDRPVCRLAAAGCAVDKADDVHEREGRNIAALGA